MNKLSILLADFRARLERLGRYALPAFITLVILTYGFLILRITVLGNATPDSQTVSSQVNTARVIRVDPDVVKKLSSLQDNSVNVQALFQQARQNPFQ